MTESNENDDYTRVSKLADEMKLEGEDRHNFIHGTMTRLGYEAEPRYVRPDSKKKENKGSSWFPSSS